MPHKAKRLAHIALEACASTTDWKQPIAEPTALCETHHPDLGGISAEESRTRDLAIARAPTVAVDYRLLLQQHCSMAVLRARPTSRSRMRLACLLAPTSKRSFSCLVAFSRSFAEAKSHRFTFVYTQQSRTANRVAVSREGTHFHARLHDRCLMTYRPFHVALIIWYAMRGRRTKQNVSKHALPSPKYAPISIPRYSAKLISPRTYQGRHAVTIRCPRSC